MRWPGLVAACALLTLALGLSLAHAQPVTATDDRGHAITLARPAQRIVALGPHLVELVFAAGGGPRVVGVLRYSDYPEAARRLPIVGDAFALNLERIAQLKPDLVVVWHSGIAQRQREQVERLGVPVFESEIRSIEDIARTLERLGILLGTRAPAEAQAAAMRQRWSALQARYAGRTPVRVFVQLWHEPLMTINGEHIIAQAVSACGGVNAFAALPALTPTVSWEAAAQSDPQLVATARADAAQAAPEGRWAELTQVDAVRRRRYALLPPDLLSRMGPRFVDGAQLLCEAIDRAR